MILIVIFVSWKLVFETVKIKIGYGSDKITIAGTGSMVPTFPKGVESTAMMMPYPNGVVVGGSRYFSYQIGRGDIVTVENDEIRALSLSMYGNPSGWIKRIIGMPGDQIELRQGNVYLNDSPIKEPYTKAAQSSFGESALGECKKYVVPDNSVFVMGDNRKGSGDSREIGSIEISAINHIIPFKMQIGLLDSNFRDTTNDFDELSKIVLDKAKYLELLNAKRKEIGIKELKYQTKLESSAKLRALNILKYDDMSFEATRSGYTMAKAMRDANYSNIMYGEAPTHGYFEAEELIENQFEFPESKKFLLDKTFQEVGIGIVEGEINGCPTQMIVQHFAGYVPPNYKKEDIASWRESQKNIESVQPSWERLTTYGDYYQKNKIDVDRINEVIKERLRNIRQIVAKMEANQWLSEEEKGMITRDKVLFEEQQKLANQLNGK